MQKQIDNTTRQLGDSLHAIAASSETLQHLQTGFGEMMHQFGDLYGTIDAAVCVEEHLVTNGGSAEPRAVVLVVVR